MLSEAQEKKNESALNSFLNNGSALFNVTEAQHASVRAGNSCPGVPVSRCWHPVITTLSLLPLDPIFPESPLLLQFQASSRRLALPVGRLIKCPQSLISCLHQ